ncbi:hypothetical protein [Georgenia wangjunii]|uniref:hypothetical protein n=1 Tax=Georgenia wangjunii TaxID=3117730 RepID=UPI002F268AA5
MAKTYEYVVTAACVVVPVNGAERYLYKGVVLPDGVTAKDRDRLVDVGLVTKRESAPTGEGDTGGGDQLYDPGVHNADKVIAHFATVTDPDERDRIIAAERAGKNRSTLVADLEKALTGAGSGS